MKYSPFNSVLLNGCKLQIHVSFFFLLRLFRQGLEEKMMLTCAQLQEAVPNTVEFAKTSPENIGHAVSSCL